MMPPRLETYVDAWLLSFTKLFPAVVFGTPCGQRIPATYLECTRSAARPSEAGHNTPQLDVVTFHVRQEAADGFLMQAAR